MSSDSAKGNASVVDLSLSNWKRDIGNSNDPESSSYKTTKECNATRADKVGHSHSHIGISTVSEMGKLYNTKYFIIKSLNHENISLSVEKGIWATQIKNEPILEKAFHNSGRVILIYSVNKSRSFQGYAQMMSSIGRRKDKDNIWSVGNGRSNSWGHSFEVKWLRLCNLPFNKTIHLNNPLNEDKNVKISRDCQELSPEIGLALCDLLDGKTDLHGPPSSSSKDTFSFKGQYVEVPNFMGVEDSNYPPQHWSWAMPLHYPFGSYHNQVDVNRFYLTNQRFSGSNFTGTLPSQHSHSGGNVSKLQVEMNLASSLDVWGLSSKSPLATTLTNDDFLDMSYEEYLEIHDKRDKQVYSSVNVQATKPSQTQSKPLKRRHESHCYDRNLGKYDRNKRRRIHK